MGLEANHCVWVPQPFGVSFRMRSGSRVDWPGHLCPSENTLSRGRKMLLGRADSGAFLNAVTCEGSRGAALLGLFDPAPQGRR